METDNVEKKVFPPELRIMQDTIRRPADVQCDSFNCRKRANNVITLFCNTFVFCARKKNVYFSFSRRRRGGNAKSQSRRRAQTQSARLIKQTRQQIGVSFSPQAAAKNIFFSWPLLFLCVYTNVAKLSPKSASHFYSASLCVFFLCLLAVL